jgi:hypothetical protein
MLGSRGWWDAKALEGFFDVDGHGDIASFLIVIPIDGEPQEFVAFPVGCDLVELLEDGNEMCGIFLADVCHSKVVNYKGKGYIVRLVTEETRGVFRLGAPVSCKMLDEALVGDAACMG